MLSWYRRTRSGRPTSRPLDDYAGAVTESEHSYSDRGRELLGSRSVAQEHAQMTAALCCYKTRSVILQRCKLCKTEYACPEFKTMAEVLKFNALIPPSMLLSPLPIELWPSMCATEPFGSSERHIPPPTESPESPARRFVSTIVGSPLNSDSDS